MQNSRKGFTLIELMIAIAIISILAVVAVPSYMDHMRRSHRNDAMSALMRIAAEQEKFYFQNSRYGSLAELGDPDTEHDWYTLSMITNTAETFSVSASANADSPQFSDEKCRMFFLDDIGRRTAFSADLGQEDDCWH